jgi:hypothetical protein
LINDEQVRYPTLIQFLSPKKLEYTGSLKKKMLEALGDCSVQMIRKAVAKIFSNTVTL